VTPVLDSFEVLSHPHAKARNLMMPVKTDSDPNSSDSEFLEPSPAPRLSRTPGVSKGGARPDVGEHTVEVLKNFGFSQSEINTLLNNAVVSKL